MGKKLSQRERSNQAVTGNAKAKSAPKKVTAKKVTAKKSSPTPTRGAIKKSGTASRGAAKTGAQPGRSQNAVEFSQDHLAAAAEFARSVGGLGRAQGLLNYLASNNSQNVRDREIL